MMIFPRSSPTNRSVLRAALLACAAVLTLGACATRAPADHPDITRAADLAALGTPVPADLFDRARPYRVGPLDILRYTVLDMEGMEGEIQVDSGGRISIPLVGSVQAAGLTTEELTETIRQGLRARFVRNPQVAVNTIRIQSQTVTVDGAVTQPGNYPLVNDMTLLRSVAAARGLTDVGSDTGVVVLRTIDGQRYAALYDLRAIRQGSYPDPRIYPNDTVIVGRSRGRDLIRNLLQLAPTLATPIVLLLQQAYGN